LLRASTTYAIEDRQLNVTMSIGVALIDNDAIGMDEVMARADQALYSAKSLKGNTYIVSGAGDTTSSEISIPKIK
jgi:diguanylate cyclase (GGDEF)-like protein